MRQFYYKFFNVYKRSIKFFFDNKVSQFAASSSFFVILSIIPFLLLVTRLVGLLFGDLEQVQNIIFGIGKEAFPGTTPEILMGIKNILKGPLFGKRAFTILNMLILGFSSLSLFNSIMSALNVLKNEKCHTFLKDYLIGVAIIFAAVLFILSMLILQPLILFVASILKYNVFVDIIYENLSVGSSIIDYLRSIDETQLFPVRNSIIQFILFFIYFAFVYSWLFKWKIKKREAFLSSGTFVILMIIGKYIFGIYFFTLRDHIIFLYGDYYTILLGALWVFFTMCFFYLGACLCITLLNEKSELKD